MHNNKGYYIVYCRRTDIYIQRSMFKTLYIYRSKKDVIKLLVRVGPDLGWLDRFSFNALNIC